MALLDTDGVYGAPRFHLAAKKMEIKAHIGAEVTCQSLFTTEAQRHGEERKPWPRISTDSHRFNQQSKISNQRIPLCLRASVVNFRLPLLVSSRAGYQNLCRLITKMKLRAKKGEGAVCADELQEHASGLICLTGGAEGPLAAALAARRHRRSSTARRSTRRNLRPRQRLRRTATPFPARRRIPQSRRDRLSRAR